jgi:hypothetical protein
VAPFLALFALLQLFSPGPLSDASHQEMPSWPEITVEELVSWASAKSVPDSFVSLTGLLQSRTFGVEEW